MADSLSSFVMDYVRWRNDIFGQPPGSDPVSVELLAETYSVPPEKAFDFIDLALVDAEIHMLFSKEQIGTGLQLIYVTECGALPFCYTKAGDESRRIKGISNLRHLYSNFFERYCTSPVTRVGYDLTDGAIGYLCYMLWDIFALSPRSASPRMIGTALDVMANALNSTNDHCLVSAIHGLGHWAYDAPQAVQILENWLQNPTTENAAVRKYAREATFGRIQ